ncbi:MAG: YIP1 family protein, partial [Oscillospiraceae bacterium]|nr:YIP1 family protein [Oscillospiraceae bacterium]
IADTGNNRIICLDGEYRLLKVIDGFRNPDTGEEDFFSEPKGVFATNGKLYIADTQNRRIVVLKQGSWTTEQVINAPDSPLMANYTFTPESLTVDSGGRIYVVSSGVNIGVVALEPSGTFTGFLGAKRVTPNLADLFWRMFMTKEQKANAIKNVPSSYNNIAIDEYGFLYLTTNSPEDWEIEYAVWSRSKSSDYAPIRRLNSTGIDVLKRDGFFPPVGDVEFEIGMEMKDGASKIIDVALHKNGVYSLLDRKRGRIFTYDSGGNLMFAFGSNGVQMGMTGNPISICYHGDDLLELDAQNNCLIVYKRTEYGKLYFDAITLSAERKFTESIKLWKEVSKYNNNNEVIYSVMGQDYLTAGKYEEAMESFHQYRDVQNYSLAYKEVRKEFMRFWALPIVIGVILLILAILKLMQWVKKKNKSATPEQRTKLGYRLLFGHHILFHPFDGFYDMKHEKRGSVLSATIIFAFTIFAFAVKNTCTGFIFTNPDTEDTQLLSAVLTVFLPVILWCVANWCLTTLMDGEGSFAHIYMTTCYSLLPIAIGSIPYAILSNVLVAEEGAILDLLFGACILWTALLLFAGTLTIHAFTLGKNVIAIILTVLGIAIILFLGLLFANVLQKMAAFVINLVNEISFRL